MNESGAQRVVLVPGLGLGGLELLVLSHRLRKRGFDTVIFRHFPWRGTLRRKADSLRNFCAGIKERPVHFVGHSMGECIILELLARHKLEGARRGVVLGTPLNGAAVADRVSNLPGGKFVLGRCMRDVQSRHLKWPHEAEIAGIAGTLSFGIGLLFGAAKPGDGVVSVSEALSDHMADSRVLPVAHTAMVFSAQVAELTAEYLYSGRFPEGNGP